MEKAFIILWSDIVQLVTSIDITDLTMPLSISMWGILVVLPLSRTDYRDVIAGVTYTLFLTAAGITLTLAIPQRFTELPSPANQAQMFSILVQIP